VDRCASEVPTLVSTDDTIRHLASCLLIAADDASAGQVA
jgi:peptide/nickel transport system ATP-binding protein